MLKFLFTTQTGWVVLAAVGALLTGLYFGGTYLWNDYQTAKVELAAVQTKYDSVQKEYNGYRDDTAAKIRREQVARRELDTLYQESRKQNDEMAKLLSRHDLKYLAQRKPGLVARRINAGTKRVLMELERLSGGGNKTDTGSHSAGSPP